MNKDKKLKRLMVHQALQKGFQNCMMKIIFTNLTNLVRFGNFLTFFKEINIHNLKNFMVFIWKCLKNPLWGQRKHKWGLDNFFGKISKNTFRKSQYKTSILTAFFITGNIIIKILECCPPPLVIGVIDYSCKARNIPEETKG